MSCGLLLVESDEKKWQKHLRREADKWVTHALANKVTCGNVKAALKVCDKLAKVLRSWDLVMNPHEPCA